MLENGKYRPLEGDFWCLWSLVKEKGMLECQISPWCGGSKKCAASLLHATLKNRYIYVSFSLSRCFNMNDEMKRSTDFFIIIFSMAVENRKRRISHCGYAGGLQTVQKKKGERSFSNPNQVILLKERVSMRELTLALLSLPAPFSWISN